MEKFLATPVLDHLVKLFIQLMATLRILLFFFEQDVSNLCIKEATRILLRNFVSLKLKNFVTSF